MKHKALITDFDNTLYDWFYMWHQSFSAMLAEVVRISGINEDVLTPEIRAIHQKYGTSEYAFLLEEIPSLQRLYSKGDILKAFDEAVHAYRSARKKSLNLYAGVRETLVELKARGVLVIIYTESLAYYTNFRVRRLELDGLVDFVYSPPDHALPGSVTGNLENSDDQLVYTKHRYLPPGVFKPNPEVLKDIMSEVGLATSDCVYVGDSPMKDIAMAQAAGVFDVLAEYGAVQHHDEYNLLRKVSHWPDDAVKKEQVSKIESSHKIAEFSELLRFF